MLKSAALGLLKNYKNNSQKAQEATLEFQVKISKNLDGRTFSQFIKYLTELKRDILDHNASLGIEPNADMFLIFLDKVKQLTHSEKLNEMIMSLLGEVDIDQLKTKSLLNTY